jgi:HEAT repeat protein
VVLALAALASGILALPLAVAVHNQAIGIVLAGVGAAFGAVGAVLCLSRNGTSFGLMLATTSICGVVLAVALIFIGDQGDFRVPRVERQVVQDGRKQGEDRTRPQAAESEKNRDNQVPRGEAGDRPRADEPKDRRDAKLRPAQERPEGPDDAAIARLVKALKSDNARERIRAAEQLGAMREAGRPAARGLCEAALDTREAVRQAALEALEKVHPALHKPVLTLLVDKDHQNQIKASRTIAALQEGGKAAVPVLLAHMELLKSRPSWTSLEAREDIATLVKIAPDEQPVIKVLIELATIRGASDQAYTSRIAAVSGLGDIGKSRPEKRKQIVPVLIVALDFPDRFVREEHWHDQQVCLAAIQALGNFGPDAKNAIPELKKLKLNPEMRIREAATAAQEKIEKPE